MQNTAQTAEQAILSEIFIPASTELKADRFTSTSDEAGCRSGCNGQCSSISEE